MNRRAFLTGTTALAASAAAVTNARAGAGKPAPARVLIAPAEAEQLAELKAAAPGVELVVCRDAGEALAHAPEADASYGYITREILAAGKRLKWVQQGSAGVEHLVAMPELVESDIILTNMQR